MSSADAAPSHADRARTLIAARGDGALSTLARQPAGHPYGSHVLYAVVGDRPVFLLSGLAEHTANLDADPRASLLVTEGGAGAGDVLALGRVTLLGTCVRVERAAVEDAFLARHASARGYAGFKDFGYWALEVESARYIGGFGRMSWITGEAWRAAEVDPLVEAAPGILEHMNDDHADACLAYARAFASAATADSARMTGIDRHGFDLAITVDGGVRTARVPFPAPVHDPGRVREVLVAMVRDARSMLA